MASYFADRTSPASPPTPPPVLILAALHLGQTWFDGRFAILANLLLAWLNNVPTKFLRRHSPTQRPFTKTLVGNSNQKLSILNAGRTLYWKITVSNLCGLPPGLP